MNEEKNNITLEQTLAKRKYSIENSVVIINNDKPFFKKKDFEILEGKPKYFEPDKYKRSSGGIAIISCYTKPLVTKKHLKYPNPNGWEKIKQPQIFEKCHIIAYSLSAKMADKNNIFIGTNYLNTSTMKKIETLVLDYITKNEKAKVLYRVTLQYKGRNQVPTGVLIEAQDFDDKFHICRFCYNFEINIKFKYSDGTIISDSRNIDKQDRKKKGTKKENGKTNKSKNNNYIINTKTKEYHLLEKNCNKLKNVKPKYIQETTATEKDLLDENLKPCEVCK